MNRALIIFFVSLCILAGCSKDVGKNPELPFSDGALLDSAKDGQYKFYQGKDTLYDGSHGAHGPFKLRFNSVSHAVLTAGGKLPIGGKFPDGSFIVKDIYKNGGINAYAWMYKRKGSWIWGEAHSDGSFIAGQKQGPSVCAGCHSQSGNRDNVMAFYFY